MTARTLASAAAAASLVGAALLAIAPPAVADTCYPPPCSAGVSDSTSVAGQSVTVNSGSGTFTPGSVVTIKLLGFTGTATADASGNASFTFTVPSGTAPGRYTASFTGSLGGLANSMSVPFTVVAAAAGAPGQGQAAGTASGRAVGSGLLASTGADILPITVGGLALMGLGAGIVVASRRRRSPLALS